MLFIHLLCSGEILLSRNGERILLLNTFDWYKNGDIDITGDFHHEQTSVTYTISGAGLDDAGIYTVDVTNDASKMRSSTTEVVVQREWIP